MMTDKYSSLTLPSDYDQMESLIKSNKIKLMEQIVSSICYAVDNNLNAIEVFNFKDSDFIVVLDRNSFEDNLNNIYEYYISSEKYEHCGRVLNIKQQLTNKNEQEKRHKAKGSSKRKN
jgi:hypothetical protein